MSKNTLTITDNRTGKTYEVPITDGTVRTVDLRQIKAGDEDMVMFELTINIYPSAGGLLYTEITTDPAAVVS